MFLLFLMLLVGLFLLFRSGRFGPPPWYRGYRQQAGRPGDPSTQAPPPGAKPWAGPWGPGPRPEDDALKVLADRLASGDITPDEYLQRVSVLRQQQGN